jgi:hypothetical protein
MMQQGIVSSFELPLGRNSYSKRRLMPWKMMPIPQSIAKENGIFFGHFQGIGTPKGDLKYF